MAFEKLGNLLSDGNEDSSTGDPVDRIVDGLGGKFFELIDSTFAERVENAENSTLTQAEAREVIGRYSKRNVAIAAASAAVPGPLGILASAGELVLITDNQLKMVYDLGAAYGKEKFLTRDLLIDVPLQAMGIKTDLDAQQDTIEALAESPADLLQEKAHSYAKAVAMKNLKRSLVKLVPLGGPVLMSVWTKKSTKKIGCVAEGFLDEGSTLTSPSRSLAGGDEPKEILVERIKVIATLMEQNGAIKDSELAVLLPILEAAPLEPSERAMLLEEARRLGSEFEIDYAALREFPELVDDLMSDLLVVAQRDGEVCPNELAYLKEATVALGESEDDLRELLH